MNGSPILPARAPRARTDSAAPGASIRAWTVGLCTIVLAVVGVVVVGAPARAGDAAEISSADPAGGPEYVLGDPSGLRRESRPEPRGDYRAQGTGVQGTAGYDVQGTGEYLVPVPARGRYLAPVPRGGLDIDLWSDPGPGALVYPGDRATIFFRTNADCYVTILSIDTEGRVRLLYPIDQDDDWVQAGFVHQIPSPDAGYDLAFYGPPGSEYVYALASLEPMRDRYPGWLLDGCVWDRGGWEARNPGTYWTGWVIGDPRFQMNAFCRSLVLHPEWTETYESNSLCFYVGQRPVRGFIDLHVGVCPPPAPPVWVIWRPWHGGWWHGRQVQRWWPGAGREVRIDHPDGPRGDGGRRDGGIDRRDRDRQYGGQSGGNGREGWNRGGREDSRPPSPGRVVTDSRERPEQTDRSAQHPPRGPKAERGSGTARPARPESADRHAGRR